MGPRYEQKTDQTREGLSCGLDVEPEVALRHRQNWEALVVKQTNELTNHQFTKKHETNQNIHRADRSHVLPGYHQSGNSCPLASRRHYLFGRTSYCRRRYPYG